MSLLTRPIRILAPAAVLVVALALATNVLPFRQILDQRNEVEAARAEVARIEAENVRLEQRVEDLQTPFEVERIAREQLGYVRPGEEAFVVMEPEPDPATGAVTAPEPVARPWYLRIWEFLTGGDVAR